MLKITNIEKDFIKAINNKIVDFIGLQMPSDDGFELCQMINQFELDELTDASFMFKDICIDIQISKDDTDETYLRGINPFYNTIYNKGKTIHCHISHNNIKLLSLIPYGLSVIIKMTEYEITNDNIFQELSHQLLKSLLKNTQYTVIEKILSSDIYHLYNQTKNDNEKDLIILASAYSVILFKTLIQYREYSRPSPPHSNISAFDYIIC